MRVEKFKSSNLSKFINVFLLFVLLSSAISAENVRFGSIATDNSEPMQFSSERLILNQEDNLAELFDKVKIIQGNSVLSADYIKAIFSENGNKLEKIFAEYNVELKSDGDVVRAENAIYSLKDNAISLVGNAHLIQGSNKILADKIFIDTETGLIKFSGSVKTTISPSTN